VLLFIGILLDSPDNCAILIQQSVQARATAVKILTSKVLGSGPTPLTKNFNQKPSRPKVLDYSVICCNPWEWACCLDQLLVELILRRHRHFHLDQLLFYLILLLLLFLLLAELLVVVVVVVALLPLILLLMTMTMILIRHRLK
jgi:hypothetical protein